MALVKAAVDAKLVFSVFFQYILGKTVQESDGFSNCTDTEFWKNTGSGRVIAGNPSLVIQCNYAVAHAV